MDLHTKVSFGLISAVSRALLEVRKGLIQKDLFLLFFFSFCLKFMHSISSLIRSI